MNACLNRSTDVAIDSSGQELSNSQYKVTWEVGVDIKAGTYVSRRDENVSFNNPFCSWERLSGLGGTISETITAGLTDGNAIVEIEPDDIGFTSIGCEEWVRR